MKGWREVIFSEVVNINPAVKLAKDKTYPFVDMQSIEIGQKFVNSRVDRNFNGGGARFINGDVLMARITPCLENGKIAQYKNVQVQEANGSTEFIVFRGLENISDTNFIYYLVTSPDFRKFSIGQMTGTSGRQRVPNNCFNQFTFLLPPLPEQKKIADVLGALDDKIALNRQMCKTLEAMAQALFKSWFVDFEPVKAKMRDEQPFGMDFETAALFPDILAESQLGLIPEGWEVKSLNIAYDINPSRKLKKGERAPYLDMANVPTIGHHPDIVIEREMASGSKFINGDTLLARITPCLENGKTAFVDFLNDAQVGWGSTEFVVLRPKAPFPAYHGYLLARHSLFREFAIQSMSGTSGRQRIQNDALGHYLLVIPNEPIAKAFGSIITSLQKKITDISTQIKILGNIRDYLLPKLISGDIRTSDVRKQ